MPIWRNQNSESRPNFNIEIRGGMMCKTKCVDMKVQLTIREIFYVGIIGKL